MFFSVVACPRAVPSHRAAPRTDGVLSTFTEACHHIRAYIQGRPFAMSNDSTEWGSTVAVSMQVDAVTDVGGKAKVGKGKFGEYGKGRGKKGKGKGKHDWSNPVDFDGESGYCRNSGDCRKRIKD